MKHLLAVATIVIAISTITSASGQDSLELVADTANGSRFERKILVADHQIEQNIISACPILQPDLAVSRRSLLKSVISFEREMVNILEGHGDFPRQRKVSEHVRLL